MIIDIPFDEEAECEKCPATGAIDFAGEMLCMGCAKREAMNDYNEN